MKVANKTAPFLRFMCSDPSSKRCFVFLFLLAFWGLINGIYFSVLSNSDQVRCPFLVSLKNEKPVYYFIINVMVVTVIYIVLKIKRIGGSANKVVKANEDKLKGKIVVITGGYKGIGLAAAKAFVKNGCEVVLACREMQRMLLIQKRLCQDTPGAKVHCVELNLGDFKKIKSCANTLLKSFPKIDILINNAGIMEKSLQYVNGVERNFLINYLGHFYLTKLLYERIVESNTLVVNLSSIAHGMLKPSDVNFNLICEENSKNVKEQFYLYRREYNLSKLSMFYFAQTLQKRLEKEKTDACAVAINPGVVATSFFRNEQNLFRVVIRNLFLKSPSEGCQTILYVCYLDREKLAKGSYYSDCKTDVVAQYAIDEQKAEELWSLSEDILKKKLNKAEE